LTANSGKNMIDSKFWEKVVGSTFWKKYIIGSKFCVKTWLAAHCEKKT
jgi:hypothetical protein